MSRAFRRLLSFDTVSKSEIRNITAELNQCIADSGLENGTLLVYSLHTTLGLIVQETSEPFLCEDFTDFLTHLVESDGMQYKHRCALHPSGACRKTASTHPATSRQLLTNQSIVLDMQGGSAFAGAVAGCRPPRAGRPPPGPPVVREDLAGRGAVRGQRRWKQRRLPALPRSLAGSAAED